MESSLSKITLSGTNKKSQRSLPSDPGGKQLREVTKDESERRKSPSKIKCGQFTRFGSLNVNSLTKTGKLKSLLNILDNQNITILGLQEMINTSQEPYESQGYRIYQGIPGKRVMKNVPQFGTGFIVKNPAIESVKEFKAYSDRLATLTIKVANKFYTIINGHAPTNVKNVTDKESVDEFWNLLDQVTAKINKNHTKILLGDFNAKLGKEKRFRDIVGKWPAHNKTTENGRRLVELCRNHNLISKSTCFRRMAKRLRTWKHPNWKRGEHQLDHVCMDKNTHKEIYNVKVMRGLEIDSDHYLIKIKIKMTPFNKRKSSPKKPKKNYDQLKLIENEVYKLKTENIPPDTNLEDLVVQLKDIAAELAVPNKRKKHPWWNGDCDLAVEERHKCWLVFQSSKTEQNNLNLIKQRKLSQKIIRNAKRQHEKSILNQIEEDFQKNNTRQYYKNFKLKMSHFTAPTLMLRDQEGKLAHNDRENANIMARSFQKLLNCEDPEQLFDINTNTEIKTNVENTIPPKLEEVRTAINELKNNKASGENFITAEIWKNASLKTIINLHREIVKIWNNEQLPEEWKVAIIHPLHKKGDKTNPDNYRGISLLDCTYKILSRIIYNRIKDQLEKELGEYQGGFRPWRSCPDQILTLKLIISYFKARNRQLIMSFIDFKKAYDCIHRKSLLKILRNFGLHPKLVKMIELTLTDTKSKVKFRSEISDPFKVRTGLRQGDGLSPLLFNCALEYIMRQWFQQNKANIKIGRKIEFSCLGFADDLALLSNSLAEARSQLESLEKLAGKIGLKISYEKTKIMARDPLCTNKIQINNQDVELVESFKYLGEIITHNIKEKTNWKERTNKLIKSARNTKNIYNKKCISINTKLRHYTSVILPEILYASETLFGPTRVGEKDKIEKLERQIARNCIGKWTTDGCKFYNIPNAQVYQTLEPITSVIKKRRISFLGHVFRMDNKRLLRRLIEFFWNKKTTPNWIKEVKKDMGDLNITMNDLKTKSGNYYSIKQRSVKFEEGVRLRKKMVISDAERLRRSEALKNYWRKRREAQTDLRRYFRKSRK